MRLLFHRSRKKNKEYENAKKVWKHFESKILVNILEHTN